MGGGGRCIRSCNTHSLKLKVLLVDKVEDVFDPVPVVWTSQLHWWCQCAHRQYYGLSHIWKIEVMQKYGPFTYLFVKHSSMDTKKNRCSNPADKKSPFLKG